MQTRHASTDSFLRFTRGQNTLSTVGTRIGLGDDVELDRDYARSHRRLILISPAADSEWGRRAVAKDLDGHVVELLISES